MTDSPERPTDNGEDATIPIVPDTGYAPTEQLPFAEETLVDPVGPGSLWSADSGLDLSAPGYGETYASRPRGSEAPPAPPTGPEHAPAPLAAYPATESYPAPVYPPPTGYPQPQQQAGYRQTGYSQAPQTNYVQPQAAPQTNYVQPQANYVQPQAAPYRAAPTLGFAEPSGPADNLGAQNIYQGYPSAPSAPAPQQPAWPAVIHDPVSFDYGYNAPPNQSEHPNAVLSLVLGIIGVFFFQLLAPVAWYLAAKGRREMAAFPGRWRPSGSLTAGLVLGIIGTVFLALVAMFVLMLVIGFLGMASGG